jgi:hypothetical protein
MAGYSMTWISSNLAVGRAPLSYDDLKAIREQGVDVIVNLCGEYCDLHDIERCSGFEVFHLPVHDDSAPDLEELDRALAWLDEALYLGKKALVHCRHGIGRTGTFITAYMLRRGFGLKRAEAALKKIRSSPSSFSQWQLLRKYGKKSGTLTVSEPSLDMKSLVDLGPFFVDYERIVDGMERGGDGAPARASAAHCGREHDACCHRPVPLMLVEAAYLNYRLNRGLAQTQRSEAIVRAGLMGKSVSGADDEAPSGEAYTCPLSVDRKCIAFDFRPIACRLDIRIAGNEPSSERLQEILHDLSRQLFFVLNASFGTEELPLFLLSDVVSGRFVQEYFDMLARGKKGRE